MKITEAHSTACEMPRLNNKGNHITFHSRKNILAASVKQQNIKNVLNQLQYNVLYTKENYMTKIGEQWMNTLVSIALTAASIVLCCLINSTARFGPIPRKESQ